MGEAESSDGRGGGFRRRAEELYERRGITKAIRHLVNIAALTLLGKSADLKEEFVWALERRVPLTWVRETILQTFLFAGYPRALHAFEVLDEVLEERGAREPARRDRLPPRASVAAFFRRRGRQLFEEIYRKDAQVVVERITAFHPELMDWILEDAYGKVLARPFLDVKTREILAVALLTVLNLPRQLTPHLRGALRAGAKPKELEETIRQLELFAPQAALKMARVRLERARTTL